MAIACGGDASGAFAQALHEKVVLIFSCHSDWLPWLFIFLFLCTFFITIAFVLCIFYAIAVLNFWFNTHLLSVLQVAALLLMSQQEERHLLERNVNASLQKKVEELQRNLLQVMFETILEYLNSPFTAYML